MNILYYSIVLNIILIIALGYALFYDPLQGDPMIWGRLDSDKYLVWDGVNQTVIGNGSGSLNDSDQLFKAVLMTGKAHPYSDAGGEVLFIYLHSAPPFDSSLAAKLGLKF